MAEKTSMARGGLAETERIADSLFRPVVERLSLGVAVFTFDGGEFRYAYVNPAFEQLKPHIGMVGRTLSDVWPEVADSLIEPFRRVYETGEPWTEERVPFEVALDSGRLAKRYYTFDISVITCADRRYLLEVAQDVSHEVEERLVSQALGDQVRSEQVQLRAVLDSMAEGVVTLRPDGSIEMNRAFLAIHGFSSEAEVLDSFGREGAFQVFDAEGRPCSAEEWPVRRVLRGERFSNSVHEVRIQETGRRFIAAYSGAPVLNESGELVQAVLTIHDVTQEFDDRRRVDEERRLLERERQRLQVLMDSLPVAVFISDERGGLIYTNEQVTKLWGDVPHATSADEYGLYKAWRTDTGQRLMPDDWSGARALRGETVLGEVLEIERFDGGRATILNSSVPLRDENGAVTGQVTVEQDITERRSLEAQAAREKERAEHELVRSNILKEVVAASLELDSHALAERVLATLQRSIGLKSGVLYVLDEQARLLNQVAVCGYSEDVAPLFERVPLDDRSISGQSVLHNSVLVRRFDELPAATRARAEAAGEEDSLWVVLAIQAMGRVIGNISLVFAADRIVTEEDISLFRAIADQLGVALSNAQLYERERESARLGEALARIDHDTHSSLRVGDVVSGALAEGAIAVGAQSAAVDGIEDGRWVVWYDWGFDQSIVGHVYTNAQNPHGVEAARSRKAIAIEDAFTDPRVDNETMKAYGLRSAIVAPLMVRGEPIAALYYNYHDDIHRFSQLEIDFVAKVASSLSLAIENARLYETEREVSNRLQEALLSLPDEIPGVQFAYAYHSASEAARVGGDFYDIFEMGDGLVGITVGDVAGKGLEAAALTSLVKNTIRAHASEKGAAPGRILQLTNEVVFRATRSDSFVTVFFGVLECTDSRLVFANAGHTTGALLAPDGSITRLGATGPVVGAFSGMKFEEAEAHLGFDRVLFLYTDGVTEARRGRELFGEERLFELLRGLKKTSPPDAVRAVVTEVLGYAGGELNDDMAVFAVQRNESGKPTPPPQMVEV